MRKVSSYVSIIVAMIVPWVSVSAQYAEGREYAPSEVRFITLGFVNCEFAPRSSNSHPDSLAIRFTRVMPMISFKQGGAELFFGYTAYTLSGSSKSTIFFGGRFGTEVPIMGRHSSTLLLPLLIATDFTKAEGIGPSRENFNVASVGMGAGLKYRYFNNNNMEISISFEELAQYSSEGFGVGSGFSLATLGDATLLLRNVGIGDGIVAGYRFRLQTWSMSESKFNYQSASHGPYVGIMF
jgi:hypothetical protein